MIKRTLLAAGVLLTLALAGPAPSAAQSISSPYRFVEKAQGLYAFGSSVVTDRGTLDLGPGSGIGLGLGYNVRISGPFTFAARVTYLPTDRRVYDDNSTVADTTELRQNPMFGLEQIGTADLTLMLLDATLRFNATGPRTWNRIQPFALLGVGGAVVVASDNAAEATLPSDRELRVRFRNGFTGHVGAGLELHVSERLSIQADVRDVLWNIDVPQGFLTTGRVIGNDEWVQTAHFGLGLTFRF